MADEHAGEPGQPGEPGRAEGTGGEGGRGGQGGPGQVTGGPGGTGGTGGAASNGLPTLVRRYYLSSLFFLFVIAAELLVMIAGGK